MAPSYALNAVDILLRDIMNMNKPPDETLKQGRNRSWLLVRIEQLNFLNMLVVDKYFSPSSLFYPSLHVE